LAEGAGPYPPRVVRANGDHEAEGGSMGSMGVGVGVGVGSDGALWVNGGDGGAGGFRAGARLLPAQY
jgi:hypothetical protein